jgi:hypothetical protein
MKRIHLLITVVVIALMGVACGLPAGGNDDTLQTETPSDNGISAETPEIPTPTVMPTEVRGEPFLSAPGVGNIKQLTDTERVGVKPLLAWEAVGDANRYQLIVFDETGEPYWAWEGAKAQIYMGGTDSQPPDDSSGPAIDRGYTWAVVAFGSDDEIVAASEVRPISP